MRYEHIKIMLYNSVSNYYFKEKMCLLLYGGTFFCLANM